MKALCIIPFEPPPQLSQPQKWSENFKDFINCCLKKKPIERKSAKELLQVNLKLEIFHYIKKHPFITQCKITNLISLIESHKFIKEQSEKDVKDMSEKWEV